MKSYYDRYLLKSKLEEKIAEQIAVYQEVVYEPEGIVYIKPASKHRYWPDFKLTNGIYLEVKDVFMSKDKKKHLAFRDSNPNIEVRFVFANPKRKTVSDQGKPNKLETCASWCEKNGYTYCGKVIPESWFMEVR